jgi:DNA (cytosine-5)-methyltransferase 1
MSKLRVLDLFSGIGGFSLGLERTGGFKTVAFCEIEEFPRRVLAKHWPNVPCYRDVRELTAERLAADGIAVDVITGGFPCQDISTSGKQAGIAEGTRSGLWSEIVRLACEIRPRFIIVENVANLLSGPSEQPGKWFGRVLGDLAEVRYNAEWHCIPASRVGRPIRRDRVWIIAVADEARPAFHDVLRTGANQLRARASSDLGKTVDCGGLGTVVIPSDLRVEHGLSDELVMSRIGALGNAVVPQIPELIGNAILASLSEQREPA